MKYTLLVTVMLLSVMVTVGQKLKPEEIIAKHIEAIGGAENLNEARTRAAAGTAHFRSKLPARETDGRAVIASDPNNMMFFLQLNSQEYPNEKIGYFDGKTSLPFVTAGARSPLGAFIADHDAILSNGLFLGAITGQWTLSDLQKNRAVFTGAGGKRINGRKTLGIEYAPRGSSIQEFSVKLYFDAETFHHLGTEYRRQLHSTQDRFGQLGRQAGVKLTLTETFGDHKKVDSLTLPHSYTAHYLTDSNSGVYEFTWKVNVEEYRLKAEFVDNFFKF